MEPARLTPFAPRQATAPRARLLLDRDWRFLLGRTPDPGLSHESDRGPTRRAFNGLAMAIVQSSRSAGALRVRARSGQLGAGAVEITTRAGSVRPGA